MSTSSSANAGPPPAIHRIEETVQRDICIGCGACAVATSGAVMVTLTPRRQYLADLSRASEEERRVASSVCPFSDEAASENELGAPHPSPDLRYDQRLGSYSRTMAGSVSTEGDRLRSSSGGMTTWTLQRLLEQRIVDAVIHVGRGTGGELFEYTISSTVEELLAARKSQYYATTLVEVLKEVVESDPREYALVGVPCFVKAARLLCEQDEVLRERIVTFVGLVCGHLKSQYFAESLAWQLGVAPDELEQVDFRVKHSGRSASDYDIAATRRPDGETVTAPTRSLVGGNWGHGAFQPEACNFCDDVFAETADVVFGDAWLPDYASDWRGTNVIVSRSALIDELIDEGVADGSIQLNEISVDSAATSQAGNFRHRHAGLAVRLADDLAAGLSVPRKRIEPGVGHVTARRRKLVRHRRKMSVLSFQSFAEARKDGDLDLYLSAMRKAIRRYAVIEASPWRRLARRVKKLVRSLARR